MATPPNQPPQTPPVPEQRPAAYPEPATLDDLSAVRRWLWVVAVWAVAASAIALIALIDRPEDPKPDRDAERIVSAERRLGGRIDRLEERVSQAGSAQDLTKLQSRVEEAERSASKASRTADQADERISDLEERLDDLEQRVDDSAQRVDEQNGN